MQDPKEKLASIKNKYWDAVLNFLPGGFWLLWFVFISKGHSWLHLAARDTSIISLSMSIAITVQISRAFVGFLNIQHLPKWLPITQANNRLYAEAVLILLLLSLLLHFALPQDFDGKPLALSLLVIYMGVGLSLMALWIKRKVSEGETSTLKFAALFLSPIAAAIGLAFAMTQLLGLQKDTEGIKLLIISGLVPLVVATIRLMFKDERDRAKNTNGVICTQFAALPLIPISYFALKLCWPRQLDPNLVLVGLVILSWASRLFLPKQKKAWLIKEQLQILRWQLQKQNTDGLSAPALTPQSQREVAQAMQELATLKLISKDVRDYVDKADTYRELGHLECDLKNFPDAEKSYVNAIETYDDALELAPQDAVAKSNRAGVVESLSRVRLHLRNTG
jgi:hypothetical protein